MSDEAEKAWTEWVGNHQDVRATHRLAFDAGVESQQQRIRDLEQELDAERNRIASSAYCRNLRTRLEQQLAARDAEVVRRHELAARDAVIERVRQWGDIPLDQEGGDYAALEDILNAAPEPTLAEVKAVAWDEGFKQGGPMHDEFAGEPDRHKVNPYRKGAGQ